MQRVKKKLLPDPEELRAAQTRLCGVYLAAPFFDTTIGGYIQSARTLQRLTIPENQMNFLTAITKLRKRLSSDVVSPGRLQYVGWFFLQPCSLTIGD